MFETGVDPEPETTKAPVATKAPEPSPTKPSNGEILLAEVNPYRNTNS